MSPCRKEQQLFAGWREGAPPHPGGNADDCQNKGVARKAIRKTIKQRASNLMCCEAKHSPTGTPPRVFCTKSRQAIEKKRRDLQKERQERIRARKFLRIEDLLRRRLARRLGSG